MRKQIIGQPTPVSVAQAGGNWLDLSSLASVEVSSEDPRFPIDPVLEGGHDRGWRAGGPGKQTIRINFDAPQKISRICVRFLDREHQREQEFVLRYAAGAAPVQEIVRQQWNFSPGGSVEEREDFTVDLKGVTMVELEIDPDKGRDTLPATLSEFMIA